jgi:hypothetical protein
MIPLWQLKNRFKKLEDTTSDPNQRGRDFETWLYDFFLHFGLRPREAYNLPHEQIDVAFEYGGRYFLVEAKWVKESIEPKELHYFSAKVGTKFANTVGIFISINGYNNNIDSFLRQELLEKNIILFDKEDILLVLEKNLSLHLLIEEKLRAASFEGNLYVRSGNILDRVIDIIDHRAIGREIVTGELQKLAKKYDEQLYVRRDIEKILTTQLTRSFKISKGKLTRKGRGQESSITGVTGSSGGNIFALVDRAGAGKTNTLCRIAQQLSENHVVIFIPGNIPISQEETLLSHINRQIRQALEGKGIPYSPSTFWDSLKFRSESERIKCFFIIDGINENPNIGALASQLDALSKQFINDDWLRILVSCRDVYWEYFEKYEGLISHVRSLSKDVLYSFEESEFEEALARYLKRFEVSVNLVGDAYNKCKHPLLLRFFCEAHKGRDLGLISDIRLIDLFSLYWTRKVDSIAAHLSLYRKAKQEVNSFIHKIGMAMFALNNRFVPVTLMGKLSYGDYFDPTIHDVKHLNSLYSRILDEDIILEEIRPSQPLSIQGVVLRDDKTYCTFVYEEFMEYVIASAIEIDTRALKDSELLIKIETLFDRRKSFINIFGIMLYLASIIKQKRGLNIWSKLCEKGVEWRRALLDAINKCPEELIDQEFIELLRQFSESILDPFGRIHYDNEDYDEITPEEIIYTLNHRKFEKYSDDIADIVGLFLPVPRKEIQMGAIWLLGKMETEHAIATLLEHLAGNPDLNEELKTSILRLVLKNEDRNLNRTILEWLPHIWDKDVSRFFKHHSTFVRQSLRLSKKEYNYLMEHLS